MKASKLTTRKRRAAPHAIPSLMMGAFTATHGIFYNCHGRRSLPARWFRYFY